jgi:low temperature requirement protein LtrA
MPHREAGLAGLPVSLSSAGMDATQLAAEARPWHIRMSGRDPHEAHRASTPLELLFDLCFVVAVAQAAGALHHDLASGSIGHGLLGYLIVFFAIWWPWVNFTWFASAYDTDDVAYRLLTFVQIAGVLVVTAGVPRAFDALDFSVMVVGYVIMRIALVGQWLRVAYEDPIRRGTALRFAVGIGLIQAGWVVRLAIGAPLGLAGILLLGALEMVVPVWAERSGRPTPWHPEHIAERYGLFTIIVLGECVLAASNAVQTAIAAGGFSSDVLAVAGGGLLLVLGLWWSYFKHPANVGGEQEMRSAFEWGYGHYVVFAAVAALGAGLQVAIDSTHGAADLAAPIAALSVAVPLMVYLVATAILHRSALSRTNAVPIGITVLLIGGAAVAATWIGVPLAILAMGFLLAGLVAVNVAAMQRAETTIERSEPVR